MKSPRAFVPSLLACALGLLTVAPPAAARELQEAQQSHLSITLPDTWAVSTEGAWSLAEAPDHLARVRIAGHGTGVLSDLDAEAYLLNFVAQTWATYTVDKHVRRVTCGRFVGLELYGHGAGDSWDRASFHLFLVVDPQNVTKGAVVLISARSDAWDAVHPALDRAVHALHGG